MRWIDNGITKSRAAASEARADLAEANRRLVLAEAWQGMTGFCDAAATSLASSWLAQPAALAGVVRIITTQTDAVHARAIAEVDELKVERQTAHNRLVVAEKSGAAMTRLADEADRILNDED